MNGNDTDGEILARSRYPGDPGSREPEIVMEFPPWTGKLPVPEGLTLRLWGALIWAQSLLHRLI